MNMLPPSLPFRLRVASLTVLAWLSATVLPAANPIFSWGNNGNGALGNGSTVQSNVPVAVDMTGVLAGKTIDAVSTGQAHCLALASDGTVYAWGDNTRGELGNNSTTSSSVPVAVDMTGVLAGKTIIAIAAGDFVSMALDSTGKVYTWGYNGFGMLGNGSAAFSQSLVPVPVTTTGVLAGKTIRRIAAGADFCVALDSNGAAYSAAPAADPASR